MEEQRLVVAAMATLPDDVRVPLHRLYLDGRSLRELGDELGIALGTVKSRLSRGRAQLRAAIDAIASDDTLRRATLEALDRVGPDVPGDDTPEA
jgi:RNA polymerase sigma-70 factor (ECF subfamily)